MREVFIYETDDIDVPESDLEHGDGDIPIHGSKLRSSLIENGNYEWL